jgi:hypothetical protein
VAAVGAAFAAHGVVSLAQRRRRGEHQPDADGVGAAEEGGQK